MGLSPEENEMNTTPPLSYAAAQAAWLSARDAGRLTSLRLGLVGYSMDGHLVRVEREDGALRGVFHCEDLRHPGKKLVFGACADLYVPAPREAAVSTEALVECTCPAHGIGPEWVEVPGTKSGLLHLRSCPRAQAALAVEVSRG